MSKEEIKRYQNILSPVSRDNIQLTSLLMPDRISNT